ncbi:hypothetical protein [Ralstonia sp. GX3-BWBA]|uniref:hypothetical protein n=1 Tax=Ralstonia sp. GX3-BWBA TaxID=2219865 RepID=UPI0013A6BE19|nr:hypothetical protein [Ralstonia sp. GX3-BWBA]
MLFLVKLALKVAHTVVGSDGSLPCTAGSESAVAGQSAVEVVVDVPVPTPGPVPGLVATPPPLLAMSLLLPSPPPQPVNARLTDRQIRPMQARVVRIALEWVIVLFSSFSSYGCEFSARATRSQADQHAFGEGGRTWEYERRMGGSARAGIALQRAS